MVKPKYTHHTLHYGSGLPVFRGELYQQGYGLGGLLSGLFRAAIPFFKPLAKAATPFLKRSAKTIGKSALKAGTNILSDAIEKKRPIRESVKHHAGKSATELLNKIVLQQKPPKSTVTKMTKKRKGGKPDIFHNKKLYKI